MTLGEKIKYLRKKSDMSQQTLADYLEINRNYLSRIETNKSEPTSTVILKLTNLFEVSANSLLGSNVNTTQAEEKRKYINDSCTDLGEEDLDFIIRIVSIMKEEYIKRDASNIINK